MVVGRMYHEQATFEPSCGTSFCFRNCGSAHGPELLPLLQDGPVNTILDHCQGGEE